WLAWTPARFIRVPIRGLVITAFGTGLAAGIGADALWSWLGARRAVALASLLALLCAVRLRALPPAEDTTDVEGATDAITRWSRFAPTTYLRPPSFDRDADVYRAVGEHVARAGPGPLLEWPARPDAPAALAGQTIHRQPSVHFYSGYTPLHLLLVES